MSPKKSKKKKNYLSMVIITTVLFLALAQLLISHRLASNGEIVRQLEQEATLLEKENKVLAEKISQFGSLRSVAVEAQKLGMKKTSQVINLTPQVPVALGSSSLAGNQ
jgi:hypothetical protein